MKIVIVSDLSDYHTIDLDHNMDFSTFEMIVGSYVNIDPMNISISKDGKLIKALPSTSIASLGIKENDMLLASYIPSKTSSNFIDFSGIDASILQRNKRNTIEQQTPIQSTSNDYNYNGGNVLEQFLFNDLCNTKAQNEIAEQIRKKNIESQFEYAMEHNPESFAQTTMLYINCKVNQFDTKAFIDSGAQMTIISHDFAKYCKVDHLIDERFKGLAQGVGTQKILGRVHCMQLNIEGIYLQLSAHVLEDQRMNMIIGLDMLKRFQCNINLKRNVLEIGSVNTETRFLSENELPDFAKLNNNI